MVLKKIYQEILLKRKIRSQLLQEARYLSAEIANSRYGYLNVVAFSTPFPTSRSVASQAIASGESRGKDLKNPIVVLQEELFRKENDSPLDQRRFSVELYGGRVETIVLTHTNRYVREVGIREVFFRYSQEIYFKQGLARERQRLVELGNDEKLHTFDALFLRCLEDSLQKMFRG